MYGTLGPVPKIDPPLPKRKLTRRYAADARTSHLLTGDDLAAANAERSPSEQLHQTPKCGGRLSTKKQWTDLKQAERDKGLALSDTCSHPAGYGTDHFGFGYCKFHGGNTPAGRKAGARAMGREIIAHQKAKFGGSADDINITAEEALLEEVRRSVAMVRWLEERIGMWEIDEDDRLATSLPPLSNQPDSPDLVPDPAGVGNTDPSQSQPLATRSTVASRPELAGLPSLQTITFKGTPTITDQAAWLLLYRDERAHMTKVAKMTLDAGIAERLVRVAENQGAMLATAIRHVLHALNLTPDQAALVPQVVPAILRSVSTGVIKGEVVA